jgi:hypothetical protein
VQQGENCTATLVHFNLGFWWIGNPVQMLYSSLRSS